MRVGGDHTMEERDVDARRTPVVDERSVAAVGPSNREPIRTEKRIAIMDRDRVWQMYSACTSWSRSSASTLFSSPRHGTAVFTQRSLMSPDGGAYSHGKSTPLNENSLMGSGASAG